MHSGPELHGFTPKLPSFVQLRDKHLKPAQTQQTHQNRQIHLKISIKDTVKGFKKNNKYEPITTTDTAGLNAPTDAASTNAAGTYVVSSYPTATVSVVPLISTVNQHPMITRSEAGITKPKAWLAAALPPDIDPQTVAQALQYPYWVATMKDEFQALQRNKTWSLVSPLHGQKIIGCKWVFRIKHNSNSSIIKYKAQLVAKGFHQVEGFDFT
ncbi:hypothetical protein ACOSQ2_018823 [Xanthoceras sorbifolium]